MQTIILLSLIVLGANAFWERPDYSDVWSQESEDPPSSWEQHRPDNYPSRASSNILSQDKSHQKSAINAYLAEADWVCKNQNTGDILILAPQTKEQSKRPGDKPTDILNKEQGKDIPNQQNTPYSNIQTTTDKIPPSDVSSHGGVGIINTRLGSV